MKKTLSLLLVMILCLSAVFGCAESNDADDTEASADKAVIRIGGLKGPTSMGMVKLLDDSEKKLTRADYDFVMAASADELTPSLLKGELDIAAVPANLGAMLYNNSDGSVCALAVNTLGVLYIVEKGGEEIQSISDLAGKTIYATGKGTTPEYTLRYLMEKNGLDADSDVTIEWKSEPTEVVAAMSLTEHSMAMIPQPFAAVAQTQLEDLRVAVDLTEAWDEAGSDGRLVTAVLLVRRAFAEEHPEALKDFLADFSASADYVNSNVKEAAVLVEKYGIVKAAVAEKAIPYCGVVCITGNDMKQSLEGYLSVLFDRNPKSVGGKLPADDFYLTVE